MDSISIYLDFKNSFIRVSVFTHRTYMYFVKCEPKYFISDINVNGTAFYIQGPKVLCWQKKERNRVLYIDCVSYDLAIITYLFLNSF